MSKHVDPLEATRAESIRPGKLMVGAPIGGYELQHVLGEGGMGVVWCAHDPLLDRTIAIKVLKSKDVSSAMRTRLLREAQAMAAIKHPNVLTVHRVGTEAERDYIVMELVDGGPLDHWLAFGPPDAEVMEALLAAGRGLAAAHAAGLVHRDFKPNNVLRSKDGRVLVTDFGLARGLGEDWTAPVAPGSLDPGALVTPTPTSRDNVLDAALTKTGALIGTPAYMAPEQFTGAEPDPRTDQFAYCVTAWQALTGARPFHGRTLDELRQAANQGVAAVVTQLDKPMRSVLTRGLDPDPAKRWPDMPTLLRELERAGRPPKPTWPWIAGVVAALAIAMVAYKVTRPAAERPCGPIDMAWGEAIEVPLPDQPWLAATLADHKRRWLASYDQTCKAVATRPAGKLDCLRAVRSRIAALSAVLAKDPSVRTSVDPALYLVPPELCAVKGAAPAALPDDERAIATLARSIVLPAGDALEGDAKAWAPVVPLVAVTAGLRRVHDGDVSGGRAQLERALAASEATDPRIAAFARLGLLEASLKELVHPEAGKAEVMPEELAKLLTYARSAIKLAGDEPVQVAQLAYLEAQALGDLAERSRKTSFGDAIARAGEARALFETAGDVRRVAQAATLLVELYLRRGDVDSLGDGEFAARAAADGLARAKLPPSPLLEHALARIAFARSDLAAAHRWFDRTPPSTPKLSDTAVSGIVVGPDGKPVMNAVVVAWVGELHGDPTRAFTEHTFDGEVVETGAEGKFTVHLRLGTAVMAEAAGGALRSTPITLPASSGVTLRLSPTGEASGRIDSVVAAGVDAYARLSIRDTFWTVHAPINSGTFRIGNLPPGSYQLGAIGTAGTATRRISNGTATISFAEGSATNRKLRWPGGSAIDVVVRGVVDPGATAWLVDADLATRFKRRDDLDVVAATSFDSVWSPLLPIGSRITDAGRQHYVAGAHHAIFVGDYTSIAACVATTAKHDAAVLCKALAPDARSVAIDVP